MSKVIMIQGTMSSVGKSLMVGGLCRVLRQDGWRVAPFKSQNMALNSYVTSQGLEMGRAQVMQAECAGIEPDVCMNPILLKPTTDTGSQVIVHGQVLGTMSAKDYFSFKKQLIPDILEDFHKLEEQADVIVVEGAGSPAEINLKADDIVNMGLAALIDAPVLLVGDIDRGGVFAQLLGTLELLEPDERARVRGLVINKFRGDLGLLDSGIRMLEEKGGVPVVGVVPYQRLKIDEEDSLSERLMRDTTSKNADFLVVAPRLPRMSNYTDVAPFESMARVEVRFTADPRDVEEADLVVICGSKNTLSDLLWLRESGMEAAICRFAEHGPVVGICGGFQMLGEWVADPEHVEDERENGRDRIRGLGLLPMTTTLQREKYRSQTEGVFVELKGAFKGWSGRRFAGYEIHNGLSLLCEDDKGEKSNKYSEKVENKIENKYFCEGEMERKGVETRQPDVVQRDEKGRILLMEAGCVFGTYVHGIFDEGDLAKRLVKEVAKEKGVKLEEETFDYRAYKDREYDKLADLVRNSLDMKLIYSILDEQE